MTNQQLHQAQPQVATPAPGKGMAITALVLAIVSLLLCWVPIVNNVVFFLGTIALVLAIVAYLRARKGRAGGKGMSAAAIAISVLSLVGVIVTQILYVAVLDSVGDAINDAADGTVTTSDSDKKAEAKADVLPLGESTKVGDEYTVSVDAVNLNANKVIAAVNPFNEAPKGRYVLVTYSVTYAGAEEGDPWLDLTSKLAGSDARQYDSSTCTAVVPMESSDVPTLSNGGAATYQECYDVPKAAVKDAKVFVEESMSFDDNRTYWATR